MNAVPTCAICPRRAREAGIFFTCIRRGKRVKVQVRLCDEHGEAMLKHLKRKIPRSLMEETPCAA